MFKIGQRVVCVKDHSKGLVKKGQEFIVENIKEPFCNCHESLVDVGLRSDFIKIVCTRCNIDPNLEVGVLWLGSSLFAPIEEYRDSLSIAMELIQDLQRVDKPVNPVKVKGVV